MSLKSESKDSSPLKIPAFGLIILGLTLFSWASSYSLAKKLEVSSEMPGHKHKEESRELALNPVNLEFKEDILKELEKKHLSKPEDISIHLEFTDKLLKIGSETSNVSYIIKAVSEYNKVLNVEPKNSSALLSLARVSFESGAVQNSVGYFTRYLDEKPNDVLAKNDLALAHLQNGENEQSIQILKEIISDNPKYFESHLALALAYNVAGDNEKALKFAKASLPLAEDPKKEAGANELIKSLKNLSNTTQTNTNLLSPAKEIQKYFSTHKMFKEKIIKISWPETNIAEVSLKDFPIEEMPEFAKNIFIAKTRERLKALPQDIKIVLFEKNNPTIKIEFSLEP